MKIINRITISITFMYLLSGGSFSSYPILSKTKYKQKEVPPDFSCYYFSCLIGYICISLHQLNPKLDNGLCEKH